MNRISSTCLYLVLVISTIFIITSAAIVIDGLNDHVAKSDVGIVLGSKVNNNGSLSNRLQARLNKSIELYQKNLISHIIVSGGKAKEGIDEAKAMRSYLLQNGIPKNKIIRDSQGVNTAATAENSLKIMREHQFQSAVLITQYFHITRTYLAFKQCGINPAYTAHAQYFELRDIYSLGREVVGLYDYLLFHRACS